MLQTNFVRDKLKENFGEKLEIEIIGISTVGDKILNVALSKIGEKSLFTKELEVALLEKKVHFVVHSLKDLPTTLPEGMVVGAVLERECPLDAVVMKASLVEKGITKLAQLEENSIIGSSSLRRQAQIYKKYPKFKIQSVRGNLNTRLRKLDEQDYSALILATAGLKRMEVQNPSFVGRLTELLDPSDCLYAVGQGALAVEILSEDAETAKLLAPLNHEESALRVVAERAFMKRLNGGCSAPVAVETVLTAGKLSFTGAVFSLDGTESLYHSDSANLSAPEMSLPVPIPAEFTGIVPANVKPEKMAAAYQLGESVAESLLEKGAGRILAEAKAANTPDSNPSQCPCPEAKELTKSMLS